MPKMRTVSSAKKRFKLTGTGSIKRQKANRSHILTSKSRKRKRNLRSDTLVHPHNEQAIKRALTLR
jgi:large subunit ribosomal protein L35